MDWRNEAMIHGRTRVGDFLIIHDPNRGEMPEGKSVITTRLEEATKLLKDIRWAIYIDSEEIMGRLDAFLGSLSQGGAEAQRPLGVGGLGESKASVGSTPATSSCPTCSGPRDEPWCINLSEHTYRTYPHAADASLCEPCTNCAHQQPLSPPPQ